MLYKEKEEQMSVSNYWYSYCHDNLGKRYEQWIVPCRILEISPSEYAKLLVNEYNAVLTWYYNSYNGKGFLGKHWINQADMRKWKNFINKKAREKNFQI